MKNDPLLQESQASTEFNGIILANLFTREYLEKNHVHSKDKLYTETCKAAKGKRILLISPKGWQKVSVNLGLASLAGSLKEVGFDVVIIDLCYTEMPDSELLNIASEINPFIVGISSKTAQAKEAVRVGTLLRKRLRQATFLVGGPHVTLNPEFFFNNTEQIFDFGVMSEGEISVTSLSLALAAGVEEQIPTINGIVWRKQDSKEIIINKWQPPQKLSSLPYPNFKAIHNFKTKNFCYPIVSSRGCPYSCIYCCVNLLTGSKKWRSRTPENIINELLFAHKKYGIHQFEFWDDNFTLDMNRAKKFCNLLIQTGIKLSWWCHNGIRADKIDRELATLMYEAGCTSVAFGIESGTPEVFASIQKGENLSDCVRAVQTLKKAGIKAVGYFIIGLPADTLDSFVETVRFQRSLGLDHYTFGLLVPYPGTKVWDIVQAEGRFLLDVTDSQHFSADLPVISFELENFPPHDIIVAYYLTKFFELFEFVENILQEKNVCHISLLIDETDGVNCATGLFYSLFRCKDNVQITLFTNVPNPVFYNDPDFEEICQSFTYKIIATEKELSACLAKTDVIVTSKEFSKMVKRDSSAGQFCLQFLNPIEALVPISNGT